MKTMAETASTFTFKRERLRGGAGRMEATTRKD